MRIVAISSVKNEADLTEIWCRHHARLLDHLYVISDADADATNEILDRLIDDGLPITRWSSGTTSFSYRQADVMNAAIARAMDLDDFDWCAPLDADEFVEARSRDAMRSALGALPRCVCGATVWSTWVPVAEYGDSTNPLRDCYRRRTPEGAAVCKAVAPREILKTCRTSVGAHCVTRADGSFVPGVMLPWKLAHLPVRTPDQVIARTIPACSKVFGPGQTDQDGGWYRDGWLHAWKFNPTIADIQYVAMHRIVYADHPPPTGVDPDDRMVCSDIEIRYPELARIDVFRVLARHIDDLRAAIAEVGGEGETLDVDAVREGRSKPEALAMIEAHIEKLSRQRWALQRARAT